MTRLRERHAPWLIAVLASTWLATAGCDSAPPAEEVRALPIGGDFKLTDHNGKPFELPSLRGNVVLVFFGFTFCPDACPTTLSRLVSVSQRLGDDRTNVKTLYITLDPKRDTPEVLKANLRNFDLDAIGLTGTKAQIDEVVELYGATYEIDPTPDSVAGYTVAHTTWLYALDRTGEVRRRFRYGASVEEILEGVKAILASDVRSTAQTRHPS